MKTPYTQAVFEQVNVELKFKAFKCETFSSDLDQNDS